MSGCMDLTYLICHYCLLYNCHVTCIADAAPDESVDEIQFIKSQLQDMGKRFDYLEHWLGECKTPRPAAAGHH